MAGVVEAPHLPPLREEIHCRPGPVQFDGSPSFTLHDPANNRFFRLGWREYEMLLHWSEGNAGAVAERINADTTLRVGAEDVEDFYRFLLANNLLFLSGPQGVQHLWQQARACKQSAGQWLLHNYLFFKIPLCKPDRLLVRMYRYVYWIYSGWFAALIVGCGVVGIYLVSRQWDRFLTTFPHFFNWQGMGLYFLMLVLAKVLHEFGHALTAHRFGCRVPTMGVAFMVMYPMLYTDASETWKLNARGQRLAVASAGVIAELGLAALATLLWSFLSDGPLRSGVFLLATTTWITTLAVNLSPFMRFDGYYLLADYMKIENLQPRAFAYNRWHLRRQLFALEEPPPETVSLAIGRFYVVYAWCTWLYRLFLFLGIAWMVYQFFFKLLGIFLMAVEIGWFVVKPIWREMQAWMGIVEGKNKLRHGWRFTVLLLAGFGVLLLPWRQSVDLPALIQSANYAEIYLPRAARLDDWRVKSGQVVKRGELLAQLSSEELDYHLQNSALEGQGVAWRLAYQGLDKDLIRRRQVLLQELRAAVTKHAGVDAQQVELEIRAPFDGLVLDLNDQVQVGQWLAAGESLLVVIDPGSQRVEAYVGEADLDLAGQAETAIFYPDDPDLVPLPCRVEWIDQGAAARIPDFLSSNYGGPVAARQGEQKQQISESPMYRVLLRPQRALESTAFVSVLRGSVQLHTPGISPVRQLWRKATAALVRESGF